MEPSNIADKLNKFSDFLVSPNSAQLSDRSKEIIKIAQTAIANESSSLLTQDEFSLLEKEISDITEYTKKIDHFKFLAKNEEFQSPYLKDILEMKKANSIRQSDVIDIFLIAASGKGTNVLLSIFPRICKILDFDEPTRIQFLKYYSDTDIACIPGSISKFDISDPSMLIELAKRCARETPYWTARSIQNFGIKDESVLFEIALLCIDKANNEKGKVITSFNFLRNFDIQNKENAVDLIKIYIHNFPVEFNSNCNSYYMSDFGLNQSQLSEIADVYRTHFTKIQFEVISEHFLSTDISWREGLNEFKLHEPENIKYSVENLQKIRAFIEKMSAPSELNIKPLLDLCNQIENPENFLRDNQKNELFYALVVKSKLIKLIYAYLTVFVKEKDDFQKVMDSGLISRVLDYPHPQLRFGLFEVIHHLEISKAEKDIEINREFDRIMALVPPSAGNSRNFVMDLARALAIQGVDLNEIQTFLNVLFTYKQNFKSSEIGGVLIEMLVGIYRDSSLSPVEKGLVFRKIVTEADLLRVADLREKNPRVVQLEKSLEDKNLPPTKKERCEDELEDCRKAYNRKWSNEPQLIAGIRSVLAILRMGDCRDALQQKKLSTIMEEKFKEIVPLGKIDDFEESFARIFLYSRNPDAIFQYASGLKTLKDQKVMDCLGKFITSVLNGTYKTVRYDVEESQHLKHIAGVDPDIFRKWQQGKEMTFDELGVNQLYNYREWLIQKIDDDEVPIKKLGLNYLQKFRENPADVEKIMGEIELEIGQATNDLDLASRLALQLDCLKLLGETTLEGQRVILNRIKEVLQSYNDVGFVYSVKERLLPIKTRTGQILKVFDTDNPIDILLSATETGNTCQSINGSPLMNKGLLGYLMDGWNRLLKVSDSENGKILGRCLIRLLWDGERVVLFKEISHPGEMDQASSDALWAAAKMRAQELGVPLLSDSEGRLYGKPIISLGKTAPFDYSDAMSGLIYDRFFYSRPKVIKIEPF